MKISHLSLSNLNMQWQPRLENWSRIPICVKCDTVVPSTQLRCKSFFHKKSNFLFLNLFFSKIALLLFYFGLFWGWFYKNLCVIFLSVLCFYSVKKLGDDQNFQWILPRYDLFSIHRVGLLFFCSCLENISVQIDELYSFWNFSSKKRIKSIFLL